MAVPESIRKVERPRNTVVIDYGKDGPYRYAVRERNGVKYVAGGNPQPVNGKIIGHIRDGKYVPIKNTLGEKGPEALSYGAAALVKSLKSGKFS